MPIMTLDLQKAEHNAIHALRREFSDWRPWLTRALVICFAAMAGLTIVAFTWLTDLAFAGFQRIAAIGWWLQLLWMPAATAAIVWLTRRYAPGAAGSGIPQVMAALDTGVASADVPRFVSLRLAFSKLVLTAAGLLAGLSLGREGPSVQIAAGVMHSVRRWLPERTAITEHGLLIAGGAAGIAATFNAPLAGVMFAIEELSRRPEQRSSGLLVAAIVLAGLMAVSVYGNSTYFGVIQVTEVGWSLLGPGLLVTLLSGVVGGLFSRLLLRSLTGQGERILEWRRRHPMSFAAACGAAVALIALATAKRLPVHARASRRHAERARRLRVQQTPGDLAHGLERRAGRPVLSVARHWRRPRPRRFVVGRQGRPRSLDRARDGRFPRRRDTGTPHVLHHRHGDDRRPRDGPHADGLRARREPHLAPPRTAALQRAGTRATRSAAAVSGASRRVPLAAVDSRSVRWRARKLAGIHDHGVRAEVTH